MTDAAAFRHPVARLAAPLILFFLVQSLADLTCLTFVGRLGSAALAGFGVANVVFSSVLALMFGFDTGVQALISRATGAGNEERAGRTLIDALGLSGPLGAALAVFLWSIAPVVAPAMLHDPAAAAAGVANLRAAAPAIALLALTIPVNAAWIGSGRPRLAFFVTLITAPAQIGLSFVFIFGAGPVAAEGIAGAGTASVVSAALGVLAQLTLALRLRLVRRWAWPSLAGAGRIVAIGWPVSTQQSLLQVANVIAFAIVASFGAASAAAANVLLNLTLLPIQISTGFGVAAATLVGQALGRSQRAEARGWGWRAGGMAVVATGPLGLAAAFFTRPLLGLFLHDPTTIALALWPARVLGLSLVADTLGGVLSFAFRGAGATKVASGVGFAGLWLVQLPLMWWVGSHLGHGLLGVVAVQAAVAITQAALLALIWRTGFWAPSSDVPPNFAARRIAILGGAGSGKSTLARRLGETLGERVIHLDHLAYGPGWTVREPGAIADGLAPLIASGGWIVEGTYGEASALTLPRADAVVWLDQPVWLRLWRTWRKTQSHRGRPRADRPDGCEEVFGWSYVRTIVSFGGWSDRLEASLTAAGAQRVIRLRGDRSVERFASALSASAPGLDGADAAGGDRACA
jgi:putative MATE family efflux protein